MTHDNPTYQNYKEQLSRIAIISCINCFTGSTFGFDEVYSQNVNVVDENRKYLVIDGSHQLDNEYIDVQVVCKGKKGRVEVKGSWDNWKDSVDMCQIGESKHKAILRLENKSNVYEYKLIVDGEWVYDSDRKVVGDYMNN